MTPGTKPSDPPISIQNLHEEELEHVIRVFSTRVGLDRLIKSVSASKIVPIDDLLEALSLDEWPTESATYNELIWCSEPLTHEDFKRLREYSVHWQKTSQDWRLWIAHEPSLPTEDRMFFDKRRILISIFTVYRIYLDTAHEKHYRSTLRIWHLKRLAPTILFTVIVLVILALNSWQASETLTLDFWKTILVQSVAFVSLIYTSHYLTGKLGFIHGMITITVVWLFLFHFFLFGAIEALSIDLPQWPTELISLGLSILTGFLIAELKHPLKSVGQMLSEGGWTVVYKDVLATPALMMAPTYGAIKIFEYLIKMAVHNNQLAIAVVPIGLIVIVASAEVIRRELSR